jgi:hypothetical protein
MAQTYAEFKTYLTNMLWRQNDTDLNNNLDNLIRMANSELSRKLNIQRREMSCTIYPTREDYSLPDDFSQMIALSNLEQSSSGPMKVTTKSLIHEMRVATESVAVMPFYYVQRGADESILFLIGPFSQSARGQFDLTYRTSIPDYSREDASWVEDLYLDLYVYTVFKHCAIFLREDERVAQYSGMMQDALTSSIDEDLREVQFGGSPLSMRTHHNVPRTKFKV